MRDRVVASWQRRRDEYGRTLGWARHMGFACLHRLGVFRYFAPVDWSRARRLVFVCGGNICRSPYAEARARALGLPATSFGLTATSGSKAAPMALTTAAERGLDLGAHRASTANDIVLSPHDVIVAMEPLQGWRLRHYTSVPGAQLTLLGLWSETRRPHVEDPYGLGPAYFRVCFALIDAAVAAIAARVRTRDD